MLCFISVRCAYAKFIDTSPSVPCCGSARRSCLAFSVRLCVCAIRCCCCCCCRALLLSSMLLLPSTYLWFRDFGISFIDKRHAGVYRPNLTIQPNYLKRRDLLRRFDRTHPAKCFWYCTMRPNCVHQIFTTILYWMVGLNVDEIDYSDNCPASGKCGFVPTILIMTSYLWNIDSSSNNGVMGSSTFLHWISNNVLDSCVGCHRCSKMMESGKSIGISDEYSILIFQRPFGWIKPVHISLARSHQHFVCIAQATDCNIDHLKREQAVMWVALFYVTYGNTTPNWCIYIHIIRMTFGTLE